jgi:hypothetical protein
VHQVLIVLAEIMNQPVLVNQEHLEIRSLNVMNLKRLKQVNVTTMLIVHHSWHALIKNAKIHVVNEIYVDQNKSVLF